MFASELLLAIVTLGTTSFFSSGLLFFGKGKKDQSPPVTSPQSVSPDGNSKNEQIKERAKSGQGSRLIPKDVLEKSKRELRTLLLEKELVSAALTRLYEAEASREITKEEREILGKKYREELKSLNEKITNIDAFIEVGDLETLRDQLLQLVAEKIDAIEARIERTKSKAEPLISGILSKSAKTEIPELAEKAEARPNVPDVSDLLAASPKPASSIGDTTPQEPPDITEPVVAKSQPARRRSTSSDGQVEELQKELLEALDRLEKLEVEG